MNLPNLITLIRILLIPLLVIFLIEGNMTSAFILFVIVGISDALDGFIARLFNQKTRLGSFLDPIADKLLLTTSYVTLATMHFLPAWLAVLVVSRDVIIMGGIGILLFNKRLIEFKPTFVSKITTCVQLLTVSFFLGQDYIKNLSYLEPYLIIITAFFTLLSWLQYIIIGLKLQGKPE
ncbi:MAG: CDP-diacylglycerol--glycerol-3-phosphate 3-phosphatidyltransferase [Deltaproteobacteria bacterium RIFOXYD12_FULL_50_9]|nr:MAG: CDP-diacylglycerol--glycerol-3-phosphate 3-phosphatidyltransferase [Deltaproteobacteria bacterium RIFOXYD12_FULL_50_9]